MRVERGMSGKGMTTWVKVIRLRRVLHTMDLYPLKTVSMSRIQRLVGRKAIKELLSHLMPSGPYLLIPFLRIKS